MSYMKSGGKYAQEKKKSKGSILLIALLCLILVGGIVVSIVLTKNQPNVESEPTATTAVETVPPQQVEKDETPISKETEPTEEQIAVDMAICTVQFPARYYEYLHHVEVEQDDTIMEVFSMRWENSELELFRLYFSKEESPTDIGLLATDAGDRYINLNVCEYSDDAFANQQMKDHYEAMMGSLDTVLRSIQSDSRFRQRGQTEIQMMDRTLRYWNISIPANMEWEETETDGEYLVTFYGNIGDERIKLYAVCIGQTILKTELGNYSVDGEQRVVSVESYELPNTDTWRQEDVTQIYTMMSSINDVIQTIMNSEEFSQKVDE